MTINFSTPAIWYPGQSGENLQEEIELMLVRTKWTQAFLVGEIHADTFLDFLDEQGFDIFDLAANEWSLGDVA
jgi:hypothetical protein